MLVIPREKFSVILHVEKCGDTSGLHVTGGV